jgi:hypothetical protein
MKVISEINLTNFDFWSGAKNHSFTYEELKEIEFQFEDIYPDGMEDVQINDLFWFEEEFICELIGLKYKKYLKR